MNERRADDMRGLSPRIFWGGFEFVPGPCIAILILGFLRVTWWRGEFPRGLALDWNKD